MTDPKIVEGSAQLKHNISGLKPDSYESDDPFAEFNPPGQEPGMIQFDQFGRYSNLPAVPGYGPRPWRRVSDIKSILDDESLLIKWKLRQVLIGCKRSPELLDKITPGMIEAIDNHRTEPMSWSVKSRLNDLVEQALALAGSSDGASVGTEFHTLMELIDAGEPGFEKRSNPGHGLTDDQRAMIDAYSATIAEHRITMVPHLIERVIVVPELGVAGRLDRIVIDAGTSRVPQAAPAPAYRIGDVKSQASMNFGHIGLGVQLACYANASWMLDMTTDPWHWEPMHAVDKAAGVIVWTPATQPGVAEIYDVDLIKGWTLARASVKALEWRTDKKIVTRR